MRKYERCWRFASVSDRDSCGTAVERRAMVDRRVSSKADRSMDEAFRRDQLLGPTEIFSGLGEELCAWSEKAFGSIRSCSCTLS